MTLGPQYASARDPPRPPSNYVMLPLHMRDAVWIHIPASAAVRSEKRQTRQSKVDSPESQEGHAASYLPDLLIDACRPKRRELQSSPSSLPICLHCFFHEKLLNTKLASLLAFEIWGGGLTPTTPRTTFPSTPYNFSIGSESQQNGFWGTKVTLPTRTEEGSASTPRFFRTPYSILRRQTDGCILIKIYSV